MDVVLRPKPQRKKKNRKKKGAPVSATVARLRQLQVVPPRNKRRRRARRMGITEAGRKFLQCAFAPPDFNVDPGQGIPDKYNGKTFMDKNVLSNSVSLAPGTAGQDHYFIVAPTPGVAYWTLTKAAGAAVNSSDVWTPITYPGCYGSNSLFGDQATGLNIRADNVDKFRYASLAAGVYTTSTAYSTSGAIQIWKSPLSLTEEQYIKTVATTPPVTIEALSKVVNGIDAVTAVPRDNYSQGVIHGAYTVSTCNEPEFEFQPILEGVNRVPSANYTGSGMFGVLNGPVLGMGDLDSIIIKINSPLGSTNTAVIKTWSCIEYRTTADSIYDRLCTISPPHDPVALELYRKAALEMPLAVCSAENAKFWETLLNILGAGARAVSYAPGPIGIVGSAASMLVDGIRDLTVK